MDKLNSHEPLLRVNNLKLYFPVRVQSKNTFLKAVDGVSFDLDAGETLGLVGESGCGKSTVGRSILHLYEPTAGEIVFDGELLTGKSIERHRRDIQMIFQDPYSSLNPRMTVEDIIGEPLDIHHLCENKDQRRKRVLELMEMSGVNEGHLTRYPHEFSGGQRQRIGIARALATNPKLIICDEPVSALDVSIQAQVLNMFESIQKETSVSFLFISHDLLVVRHIAHRIAVMYLGHIVEIGDADEIFDHPLHPYTRSLLSAIPVPDPKEAASRNRIALEGEIPSPMNAPSGCAFRTRCPHACESCAMEIPSLRSANNQVSETQSSHLVACIREDVFA